MSKKVLFYKNTKMSKFFKFHNFTLFTYCPNNKTPRISAYESFVLKSILMWEVCMCTCKSDECLQEFHICTLLLLQKPDNHDFIVSNFNMNFKQQPVAYLQFEFNKQQINLTMLHPPPFRIKLTLLPASLLCKFIKLLALAEMLFFHLPPPPPPLLLLLLLPLTPGALGLLE
ncbi:hypothetical protein FF38_07688 [Lucilia cuprina]|uniref:Uncharacterized protein n=1 Tax=Lucilia cuprina TaxID=7375 RepID=A0A0L0CHQ5_LUCCU|nr:hypothetical protein FF38_07688 [Lucilia cuprina]